MLTLPFSVNLSYSHSLQGICVVTDNIQTAVEVCDNFAPEHLELHVRNTEVLLTLPHLLHFSIPLVIFYLSIHPHPQRQPLQQVSRSLNHYGALFIGANAAEVLGDYGAGPNHTLPTGGTSRRFGGLSVLTFMRVRTWLRIDDIDSVSALAFKSSSG